MLAAGFVGVEAAEGVFSLSFCGLRELLTQSIGEGLRAASAEREHEPHARLLPVRHASEMGFTDPHRLLPE
jgi:hypothetical protein